VFVALFIVLPFVELALIVASADAVGILTTFVALVAFSLAGGWLMKREGLAVWRRANTELGAGRVPTKELLDGAMVLAGGALLLIPGFLTDFMGLLLLIPPVRALLRPLALAWMARRAARAVRTTTFRVDPMTGRAQGFDPRDFGAPGTGDMPFGGSPTATHRPDEAKVIRVDVHRPDAIDPGR